MFNREDFNLATVFKKHEAEGKTLEEIKAIITDENSFICSFGQHYFRANGPSRITAHTVCGDVPVLKQSTGRAYLGDEKYFLLMLAHEQFDKFIAQQEIVELKRSLAASLQNEIVFLKQEIKTHQAIIEAHATVAAMLLNGDVCANKDLLAALADLVSTVRKPN